MCLIILENNWNCKKSIKPRENKLVEEAKGEIH